MYEDRVAKGAALLDRVHPGWAAEIAADRLAMESCDRCILGQLYGDYYAGFNAALQDMPSYQLFQSGDYGFTLFGDEQAGRPPAVLGRFAALADSWRAAIRERLAGREDSCPRP